MGQSVSPTAKTLSDTLHHGLETLAPPSLYTNPRYDGGDHESSLPQSVIPQPNMNTFSVPIVIAVLSLHC